MVTKNIKIKNLSSREDWTIFRSLNTLPQKTGVENHQLSKLVAKELVDNALDNKGTECRISRHGEWGFVIEDDGPGIDGTDKEIGNLFSISRPLKSSKLARIPSAGALGNGLRVVAAAVLCTNGSLTVGTKSRMLKLIPQDNGTTKTSRFGRYDNVGTRIEVILPDMDVDLTWAELAIRLNRGEKYKGKTSAYFYDGEAFFEYSKSRPDTETVRAFITNIDGCSGTNSGRVAQKFLLKPVNKLTRDEIEILLEEARGHSKPINNKRLGLVGELEDFQGYASIHKFVVKDEEGQTEKEECKLILKSQRSRFRAEIPFVVEAWCRKIEGPRSQATFFINRTPCIDQPSVFGEKKKITVSLCNILFYVDKYTNDPVEIWINVLSPYVPITSDGKVPDLKGMRKAIAVAAQSAVNELKKKNKIPATSKKNTQKETILDNLKDSMAKVSDYGKYRYSLRQLYYVVRPIVSEVLKKELNYKYFSDVIADYESDRKKDLEGVYRDSRGNLYHPHTGEIIPLGTLEIEKYKRPKWQFNKILYSEKEGLFEILRTVRWAEKNDCALVTSKGFASRAARDVLDILGETNEEITFFCIHDADADGTMIYQALSEGTKARPGRKIKPINLGLDPWEAMAMELEKEPIHRLKKKRAVADYIIKKHHEWKSWLQKWRIELNAMSTPVFISWLDAKMTEYEQGKLIPPDNVLADELSEQTLVGLRKNIEEQVLEEAKIQEKVDRAYEKLIPSLESALADCSPLLNNHVTDELSNFPEELWKECVRRLAVDIAKDIFDGKDDQ